MLVFQSTPPVKAATQLSEIEQREREISIHAAREGGDVTAWRGLGETCAFQSTPPVKAATAQHEVFAELVAISIHAAREGGDQHIHPTRMLTCISIHAAREGGDAITQLPRIYRSKFQSTPPVKAATHAINKCRYGNRISIHAAREGGDCAYRRCRTQHHISIHAAREGGDLWVYNKGTKREDFNPRRP